METYHNEEDDYGLDALMKKFTGEDYFDSPVLYRDLYCIRLPCESKFMSLPYEYAAYIFEYGSESFLLVFVDSTQEVFLEYGCCKTIEIYNTQHLDDVLDEYVFKTKKRDSGN